jgi:ubiquinone/menaquinone biosynthesis C-methylase UbiE
MPTESRKPDILERFSTRKAAEHYRDRFKGGRHGRTHEREIRALTELLGSLPDVHSVIDVGSGPGRLAPLLAADGRVLTQVDAAWQMLAVSRADFPVDKGGHVQGSILRIPVRDAAADLVFCHRLLNHLPDPQQRLQAVAELARIAGKYVVVSCLNAPQWLHNLRGWLGRRNDPVVTQNALVDDAHKAGLETLRLQPIRSGLVSGAFVIFKKPRTR